MTQESIFIYSEIQLKKSARNIHVFNFDEVTDSNIVYSRFNRAIKYTKTQIRLHTHNYTHRENGNVLLIIIATEMDANYWSTEYVCYTRERTNDCKQNSACF